MASINKGRNGRTRILFVAKDGKRQTVRLGMVDDETAKDFKKRIEQLQAPDKLTKREADVLAAWVAALDAMPRERLAKVGLIEAPEAKAATTLGAFLAAYTTKRTDVKQSTLTNWGHTVRCLKAFFGEDRALDTITAGDAKDWERWLQTAAARENRYADAEATDGLAKNTARKRVSNAKQFFDDAVSRDLIRKNPFADLSGAVGGNRSRDYFVTREEASKVIEACPDAQWRLLFALSRYGGLRCPSEHLALRWEDINWAAGRMTVRSPKTEHHDGKESRVVPIFPELLPYLEDARQIAPRDAEHVVSIRRDAATNLRTRMFKIIKRAGLTPWPKLFQNLRSTRETELAETFPIHVVCQWIGNSAAVAAKHYLQVTDDHYEQAAHKAAQYDAVGAETAREQKQQRPIITGNYGALPYCTSVKVGDEGLEPPTLSV